MDKAAYITARDLDDKKQDSVNPWRLCPVTQVEEVKCILRLMPIWLCTIIYSVVFTQMASLFVEQGAAMNTSVSDFKIPPASMSSFDILSVALFIFLYRRVLEPVANRFKKNGSKGITELHRMGIGLVIAVIAMIAAGIVECYRLKYADKSCTHCDGSSSLSIFWQVMNTDLKTHFGPKINNLQKKLPSIDTLLLFAGSTILTHRGIRSVHVRGSA